MAVGVQIRNELRSGTSRPLRKTSGQYMVAGLTERGDTSQPIRLTSMVDYARYCGDLVPYGTLFDDLTTFFNEGGTLAYVSRVVGSGATVGTLNLVDGAVAPVPTLRVDAQNPGPWSSRVTASVTAGAAAELFTLNVYFDGALVEQYPNLASPAAAVTRTAKSAYIKVTDLGSATAAPNNNPAVADPTPLSAGTDDRAAVTDTNRVEALARFAPELGTGAVAVPGSVTPTVQNGLIVHAAANHRVALLAAARGTSAVGLISTADALGETFGAENAGLFAPWVQIPDGTGGVKTISPEGFVAAKRSVAHDKEGPWLVPAAGNGAANYIIGLDQSFDQSAGDALDEGRVSAIRAFANIPTLDGWRSLSRDEVNYGLLKYRDLMNTISVDLKNLLNSETFATLDGRGQELSRMNGLCIGYLEPIHQAGGLFEKRALDGSLIDPGYAVETGPAVNPLNQLQHNIAAVNVAVRPSPSAALIYLTVIQVGLTAAV